MRKILFAAMLAAFLACMLFVPAVDGEGTSSSDPSSGHDPISDTATIVAQGKCGSGTGASGWSYTGTTSSGTMTLTGGSVESLSSSSWSSWTLTSLKIGDTEVPTANLSTYKPSEIIPSHPALSLTGNVTAASSAMKSIDPISLTVSSDCTSIGASMFLGCSNIKTVTLSTAVTSIGAKAFENCTSITEFDVKHATVDKTAFKGCSSLKTFKAEGSETYDVSGGILYTSGGDTLYICPTGKTGIISLSDIHTNAKVINLGYAKVSYILDAKGTDRALSFADGADVKDINSRGLIYSSLGMKTCTVSDTKTNQGDFTITYTLYNGWAVVQEDAYRDGATPTYSDGTVRLMLESGRYGATFYPMGVRTVTYEEIAALKEIDGWSITLGSTQTKTGIVQDIDAIKVSVTGYIGSDADATLSGTVRFHGIGFEVTSVSITAATAGNLQNLTIGEGIPVGKDSFTGLSGLRSVDADYVSEVGDGAFRFCTALETASFTSCSKFGAYAFESCWSLETLELGSGNVTFGADALRGCKSLRLLAVGMDAEIQGADGVAVLHYDMSNTSEKSFQIHGDFLLITWANGRQVDYSDERDASDPESEWFYYGSPYATAVIPVRGEMYITVTEGPLETSGRILVVFDYGLGVGYETQKILTGTTASDPGSKTHLGYHFQYWALDGEEFDFQTELIQSTVLTAVWSKEDPVDTTPIYLGVILATSVIATFAVLAIGRRKH